MDGQKNAPLNVAVYCRAGVSEYALETQKRQAAAVIQEHGDWNLVATYTDFGTGPRFTRRPSFKMMMADCRKGKIDKILVRSISTLARDISDCVETLRELSGLGVSVKLMDEGIDTKRDSQWLEFLRVCAAVSPVGCEDETDTESTAPMFL